MPPRQHPRRRLFWSALQLVICLIAWGVQSGLAACSINASYNLCPTALEAAQFLVGANSPLEISNAVWEPGNCTGPATWLNSKNAAPVNASTRILITDFSCHGLASDMPQGALVLSNGDATSAAAVSNTGNSDHGFSCTYQDADMKAISAAAWGSQKLRDTLNLTFDVTSWGTGKVYFQYVFGSDEYPEWAPSAAKATSDTNDIFAFFMWALPSGTPQNMALLLNSNISVSIGSINILNNSGLYTSNTIDTSTTPGYPGPYANAMDGYTVLMNTSTHSLIAGTTYRMKLAIADMYDSYLDSVVWIKQGSLQFVTPPIANCSGAWTNWTSCSANCSGGNTSSTYIWKWPASGGGITCKFANNTVNTTSCNMQPCPITCVGSWTAWTNCSKPCGNGTSTSTFVVTTPAAYGGTNCSFANKTVKLTSCNTQLCPVDCVGNWTSSTNCSKPCGNGTQNSTYIISTVAANGGVNCSFANNTVNTTSCNTQPCPVNCSGSWTAWTNCSQTCGVGNRTSTYMVTIPAAYNGANCSFTNGTVNSTSCNIQPCPVSCVGSWVNTTSCTKPCGNGTLTQTFVITTPPAFNGTNCTTTNGSTQTAACNTQACVPVNCVASWVNTTSCNQSCGNGTLTQTYVITTPAANGGTNCTAANGSTRTAACNTQACVPVNCVASWVNTTSCNQSCGNGTLTQTYVISTPAAYNGTNCSTINGTTRAAACNTQACAPVNCVASWVNTTSCNQSCGGGTLTQTYIITTPAANGGTNCTAVNGTTQTAACNTQACPLVNCVASWVNTTSCNQSCGGGTLTQTYIITTPAANGGTNCTAANGSTRTAACNTPACPLVNCVASWVNTTSCNQSCGGGTLTQTYIITTPAAYNGTNCSTMNGTTRAAACNTQACPPVNCVASWVNTTSCNQSCGGGTLTQTYVITTPAANGATNCTAANGTTQTAACNSQACPLVNCVASWVNTTSCNQSCGGGTLTQTYVITTPAANGGTNCTAANGSTRTAACNTQACMPVNCVANWVNTTSCNQSCGGGALTQTYVITTPAANGGTNCTAANGTTQTAACNTQACMPVNCVASWVNTTSCNQSCGGGTLTQTYVITTPAANGGTNCTAANGMTQTEACNTQACMPVNCVAGWVNTTGCDQPCGGGTLTQTYVITTSAAYNGVECAATNGTTQAAVCNTQACTPINCVGSWVNTTDCDQPCGGGMLSQTYVVNTPAAYNGTDCATTNGTTQAAVCNTQACTPINCVGSWVNTTDCDQPCGGGMLSQTYVVNTPAAYNGTDCATTNGTTQAAVCNTQACTPINCVGSWVDTTDCDQPCGGGMLSQTYVVTTPEAYNGTDCATYYGSTQAAVCNTQACTPIDCFGSWVDTTECDQSCGGGTLTQTYVITTPAAYYGTDCATANGVTQTVDCNTQACRPVDCFGSWVDTTDCDQPCGGGTVNQTFIVTTEAANNGTDCDTVNGTTQAAVCNTQSCTPIDCVGSWVDTTECDQSCGGGTLTQTYVITTEAAYNGTDCASANGVTQTVDCNTQACRPVDCFGSWVDATDCDQPCGGGTVIQAFVITTEAENNGTDCATANGTTQAAACNTQACTPTDCVGSWVDTTECDQSCGGGTLTQTYVITTAAADNGTDCATANGMTQTVDCNTQACRPVDCFGSWVDTTDCNEPCGGGTVIQAFVVTTNAENNGTDCAIANGTTQATACNTQACTPTDCVGSWVDTTECDQSCGGGTLTQTYVITTEAAYNGTDCATANGVTQTVDCNTRACRPVNCFGSWVDTTDCDQPCGGGTVIQTFVITTQAENNGTDCDTADGATQAGACNTQTCMPIDCVGSWVDTTDCDQPCAGGTLTQTYVITTAAAYNGTACNTTDGTTRTEACNTQVCPLLSSPPASASPDPSFPSPGSPSPPLSSPSSSPSPSPGSPQPTPPSSPTAVPSPASSSPGASPSPSLPAHSPSPSPRPSSSPSPHPAASPSPRPSLSPSPLPSPSPSPAPVPSIINETVLQQIPYYISPPVLPPLPAMNDTNITIRGGTVTITGVKIEAGGVSVAGSDKTTPASPAPTRASLPQTNLTLRWAAFNGSLGFYTLGVTISMYGEFELKRTMSWTWSTQYSAWTTEVAIQGHLLARVTDTNEQGTGLETLNPAVSGLLSLFNSKYPGPGFSGTSDWAGLLDMVPDPFAYWGISTSTSNSSSTRRLMAVPQTAERYHCCPTIPERLLLQTDNGNTPVQGRVSVREVNSKAISNTASSQSQTSATDDEISASGPVTDGTPSTAGTTSYKANPFQAFIAALSDPKNRKFVILTAVLAPTGLAVCAASVLGAALYRKKRRKEDGSSMRKQQKLKDEQDTGAEAVTVADLAAVRGTTATSSAVPARQTRRRRTGTVRGKAVARFSSSSGGGGGGGGGGLVGGPSSWTGGSSHVEFLDPADASHFASFTGYNYRGRKQHSSLTGRTPMEGAEDGQVLRLDPVNTSLSGDGMETIRSPGKQRGRFGSITGSLAGMASSVAGAISNFRHSQTGQAYKVHGRDGTLTSPRSTVELPREGRERGPTLPGAAGTGRSSLDLGRQGFLDLSAYPGAQKAPVNWGIAGALKVTPPNSAGQTRLTPPPPSAARIASAAAAATAPRPQQGPARAVPAQWTLPTPDTYVAQSPKSAWATGKAAAWAAELRAASRGSTPPDNTGESGEGDDDDVITGGSTFLLPSRSRRFGPGAK